MFGNHWTRKMCNYQDERGKIVEMGRVILVKWMKCQCWQRMKSTNDVPWYFRSG